MLRDNWSFPRSFPNLGLLYCRQIFFTIRATREAQTELRFFSIHFQKDSVQLRSHDSSYVSSVVQSCLILCNLMDCSPPGSSVMDSPGKNTRVNYHSLLQGIFPTQGLNLGLLYHRQTFLASESPGKPQEWRTMG